MRYLFLLLLLFATGCGGSSPIAPAGDLYVVGVACYSACPWLTSGAAADTTVTNDADVARTSFVGYATAMIANESDTSPDPDLKTNQNWSIQFGISLWTPGGDIESTLTTPDGHDIEFFIITDGKSETQK